MGTEMEKLLSINVRRTHGRFWHGISRGKTNGYGGAVFPFLNIAAGSILFFANTVREDAVKRFAASDCPERDHCREECREKIGV